MITVFYITIGFLIIIAAFFLMAALVGIFEMRHDFNHDRTRFINDQNELLRLHAERMNKKP